MSVQRAAVLGAVKLRMSRGCDFKVQLGVTIGQEASVLAGHVFDVVVLEVCPCCEADVAHGEIKAALQHRVAERDHAKLDGGTEHEDEEREQDRELDRCVAVFVAPEVAQGMDELFHWVSFNWLMD